MMEKLFSHPGDGWYPRVSDDAATVCFGNLESRAWHIGGGVWPAIAGRNSRFIAPSEVTFTRENNAQSFNRFERDLITNITTPCGDIPELVAGNWFDATEQGFWGSVLDNPGRFTLNNRVVGHGHYRGLSMRGDLALVSTDDTHYRLYRADDGRLLTTVPLPPKANTWRLGPEMMVTSGYFWESTLTDLKRGDVFDITLTPWRAEAPPALVAVPGGAIWAWTFTVAPNGKMGVVGMPVRVVAAVTSHQAVIIEGFDASSWIDVKFDPTRLRFLIAGSGDRGALEVHSVPLGEARSSLRTWGGVVTPIPPDPPVDPPPVDPPVDPPPVDPPMPEPEPPPTTEDVVIQYVELQNLEGRLEDTYHNHGHHPITVYESHVNKEGWVWREHYWSRRSEGMNHEQAMRWVENQIDVIEGRPPRWGEQPPPQPPVTPPGSLVDLHIDGTTWRRPDNSIWKMRLATGFSAFQDFLAGRDLDPYANWTRSVGCNGWRIFYTWVITGFNPLKQLGAQALRREIENFRVYMDGQGLYSMNTAWCDQVNGSSVLMSRDERYQLLDCIVAAMQRRHVELMNEAWKNGGNEMCAEVDPARLAGVFAARSSWQDGERPDVAGSILDWTGEHTPRDGEWQRKAKNILETTVQGVGSFPATKRPGAGTEPIGIFEKDVPGSRTANPSSCADYFAVAELFSAGAILHGDGATLQRCNAPGPNAQACAEAVKAARESIPADAQLGAYTRGGLDDCPIEHSDSKAMRTFAMIQGNKATVVVVEPKPDWSLVPRNGWRVDGRGGPFGHTIYVSR